MQQLNSYVPIMCKWPSFEVFGDDIGIDGAHARTLKKRDNIPSQYWIRVEEAAKRRGIPDVTIKILAQIAAVKKTKKSKSQNAKSTPRKTASPPL